MTWSELFNIFIEHGKVEIRAEYMDKFIQWINEKYPAQEVERTETTYGKSILKQK